MQQTSVALGPPHREFPRQALTGLCFFLRDVSNFAGIDNQTPAFFAFTSGYRAGRLLIGDERTECFNDMIAIDRRFYTFRRLKEKRRGRHSRSARKKHFSEVGEIRDTVHAITPKQSGTKTLRSVFE